MQSDQKQGEQKEAGWVFRPGDTASPTTAATTPQTAVSQQSAPNAMPVDGVRWSASEFIAHDRNASWYLVLGGGAVATSAIVYLLTRDEISSAMIVIVAILFGVFAGKRPRTLDYTVDNEGITIGPKKYPYGLFKSFSVMEEGALHALSFMPMRRFMPIISVYYSNEDEDKILQKIANFLPFEEHRQDVIDKFMHKIRF